MDFFKLYTPPKGGTPRKKIALYYHGIPLYSTAVFELDRYVFNLPLNLRDKMSTGNMYADFQLNRDEGVPYGPATPEALILSDRYD